MLTVRTMLASLCTAALCVASVCALGGDHPPGKLTQSAADWPKGLAELLQSRPWVIGHWVNSNDFFYYKGTPKELNEFLARYGKLPDTPRKVVLHAGVAPRTGSLGGPRDKAYDFSIHVMRRGWGAPLDPARDAEAPGYVVTVHVWLSDHITLADLALPTIVDVESAGDINDFIREHRKRGERD